MGTPAHRDKLLAALHIFAITAIVVRVTICPLVMLTGGLHKSYEGETVFRVYRIFKEIGIYFDRLELSVYLLVITVPYLKSVPVKLDDLKKIAFLRGGGLCVCIDLAESCKHLLSFQAKKLLHCCYVNSIADFLKYLYYLNYPKKVHIFWMVLEIYITF